MAFVLSDRIKETTTTTGTGTYTLGGATTGFETFTANLSNGDTTYYCCTDGTDFEVGLGTFTSSGTTLARTTILSSSNSNNAVSWSSGTRNVFCTLPGTKALAQDGDGNVDITSSTDGGPVLTLISNDPSDVSDFDVEGTILFKAENSASEETSFAEIKMTSADTTDGTEDGRIRVNLQQGGNGLVDSYQFSSSILFLENDAHTIRWNNTRGTSHEVNLETATPTAGRTITLPDATGTVITTGNLSGITSTGTLTSLTVTGKLDAGVLEGKGGVTYDPPGSSGSDTSTTVGLALHSGDRIVLGDQGYIRTIINATWSSALQIGQSGTNAFAGTEIYGGNVGVTLKHSTNTKLVTTSTGVTVTGLLSATTKSFDIKHPTKPKMRLRYGSLEGPENGVYLRGRLKNRHVINLPDCWTGLVHEDSITVNLTPIGNHQGLYIESIENNMIFVSGEGNDKIDCFYTVYGERKDVEKLEVEYES